MEIDEEPEAPPAKSAPPSTLSGGGARELAESFSFQDEEPGESRVSFVGSLRDMPFPELLMHLGRERKSGAIRLRRGKAEKTVYLENGLPVSISSNLLSEVLGKILVKMGKLSEEKYLETRKIAKRLNRLHGSVILEMELIGREELAEALRVQNEEKFLDLFSWTSGAFHVTEEEVEEEERDFDLDLPRYFMRGVRERMPAGLVRQRLGPRHAEVPAPRRKAPRPLYEFDLGEEGISFLKALDGRSSLKEWAKETGSLDDALRVFYALFLAGAMELVDPSSAPPPEEIRAAIEEGLRKPEPESAEEGTAREEVSAPNDPEASKEDSPVEGDAAGTSAGTAAETPDEKAPEKETPAAEKEDEGDDETAPLETQIDRWRERVEGLDHFSVLGVSREADEETIHRAYLSLAKRFHPQKVGGDLDPERRRRLDLLFQAIATAHEVLMDEDDRAEYLESLG